VGSINTLLFNGNPLLRYDGYYILADLVEVPNLRQRASQLFSETLADWCLGIRPTMSRVLPARARGLLMAYALASTVYRIVVIVGILWFLHAVLRPYGLIALAQIITVLFSVAIVFSFLKRLAGFLRGAIRNEEVHSFRALGFVAAVAGFVAVICLAPLPHRVSAPVVIEPRDAESVFVAVRGRLPHAENARPAAAGDRVQRGDLLVQLENPLIDKEIIELEGKIQTLTSRIDSLTTRRFRDGEAGDQLPHTEEALNNLKQQLARRSEQRRKLQLTAPVGGMVLPDRRRENARSTNELGTWQGTPLDAINAGCTLESGTTFCLIGDTTQLSARLVVDQADIEFVRVGQPVRISLKELPGQTLAGVVSEVSDSQLDSAPPGLLADGSLPVIRDQQGVARPASASFEVRVSLEAPTQPVPLRSTGLAAIRVQSQSFAQRIYRYLASTFRFA
jgi:putative peptide zinc metalloprotease protein